MSTNGVGVCNVSSVSDTDNSNELWRQYKMSKSIDLRNQLMVKYAAQVMFQAKQVLRKVLNRIELDDLIQAGMLGLNDAIKSFDVDRGIKFQIYCAQRIRGAILDSLRELDPVPRLRRTRSHQIDQIREKFKIENGRYPDVTEIIKWLGLPLTECKKILRDSQELSTMSLSPKQSDADDSNDIHPIDILEDQRAQTPDIQLIQEEFCRKILLGLGRLPSLVIYLHYFRGYTVKEISKKLHRCESRVFQIRSAALRRLKSKSFVVKLLWEQIC